MIETSWKTYTLENGGTKVVLAVTGTPNGVFIDFPEFEDNRGVSIYLEDEETVVVGIRSNPESAECTHTFTLFYGDEVKKEKE